MFEEASVYVHLFLSWVEGMVSQELVDVRRLLVLLFGLRSQVVHLGCFGVIACPK